MNRPPAVVVLLVVVCTAAGQIFNKDYPNDYALLVPDNIQEPVKHTISSELIRLKAGSEINLACEPQGYHKNCTSKWEFAACKPCHNKDRLDWRRIHQSKHCNLKLTIKHVTISDSGIYKCSINKSAVVTYEVVIIEPMYDEEPPKLLDVIVSPNATVKQFTNIVIQCKVSSRHAPTIFWLKQSEHMNHNDLQYRNKHYYRINITNVVHPVPNMEDVYVGKLNLHNTSIADSGVYVCVAMTGRFDFKNVSIKVISRADNYEVPASHSLLFLIPLPFVLIPAGVWLCYYRNKGAKHKKVVAKQECGLIQSQQEV